MARGMGRWLAWGLWVLILVLLVLALLLGALNDQRVGSGDVLLVPLVLAATLTSSTVGAIVASRQPRNPLGWLFLILSLCIVLGIHGEDYPIYAIRTNPGSLPAPEWVAWFGTWAFAIAGATFPLILLLFPTGRVPSPRWRPVPWLLGGATVWAVAIYAVDPHAMYPMPGLRIENPAGIEALGNVGAILIAIGTIAAIVAAVACFVGLFLRFRRARGEERQQLRWLAYVGIFALVLFASMFVLDPLTSGNGSGLEDALWILFVASLTIGVPVACGVAILKYKLYELDVVIKKTVVFGVLAVFVTLVYIAVVVGVGALVAGEQAGFNVLAFGAIALIALVLQPLRDWARRLADRLVYGKRATPYEVLSEFTERVGETLSVEDTISRMTELITAATGASRAEVWLRVGDELRLEASSPPRETDGEERLRLRPGDQLPVITGATSALPVRHLEPKLAVLTRESDRDAARLRVLRDVVQGLEAAEVDGRLHGLRVPGDAVRVHDHGERRLSTLRLERRGQPLVGEERRIDPAGQVSQVLERRLRILMDVAEQGHALARIALRDLLRESRFDGEGDELLLGAVVEVALDPPPLLILRRHQSLA